MFGLKKKGRAGASKLHGIISNKIRPHVEKFAIKMRIAARVRIIERWSRKHPKRLCCYYIVFAVLLFSANAFISVLFYSSEMPDSLNLTQIVKGDPLNGMQTININRELIREALSDYSEAERTMVIRLDSLFDIKEKTHADSIEIAFLWQKLNNQTTNKNIP